MNSTPPTTSGGAQTSVVPAVCVPLLSSVTEIACSKYANKPVD